MELDIQYIKSLSYYVPLILFFGALIYSIFGFGDALFSIPLLSFVISIKTAVPLMTLSGATIAAVILFYNYKSTDSREAGKLLLGSLFGVPIGIYILKNVNEDIIKTMVGLIMISYSIYQIKRGKRTFKMPPYLVYVFGFIAGMLAGAFNTSGPPVVMYGTLSGWTPAQFTATLQGYFLPTNLYVMVSQFLGGLLTLEVISYYLVSLPFMLAAFASGTVIRKQIPEENYKRYIYILLLIIGFVMLGGVIFSK